MPNTKPDLTFNSEGVCNACNNYDDRSQVDWVERKRELVDVVSRFKSKHGTHWDCIVPVSGGKDSTYQVIQVLELGLKPLCVTSTTCDLSEIGRRNIENIKNLGVDYVEFSPNKLVRKKLNRIGLMEVGDISWPEHVGIFTIPVRAAVNYRVPLIIWGENSQNEYGGPATAVKNNILNRAWLEEFGGLLGLRTSDLIGVDGLTDADLIAYKYPSDDELEAVGVTGIFLGHFLPWDGLANTLIAQSHGFESYPVKVEGNPFNYENLDNHQTGIHDYFKFLKFGFGRTTDMVSLQIRRNRISRELGMKIVKDNDGKFPWRYLGKSLEDILAPLDMAIEEFEEVCDRFTNKALFKTNRKEELIKDSRRNLTKINYDNI